mmetsp:Transcript_40435/g.59117  ORF Transcript_40435/g.59117 Transcript_40435/m.59117 type:complete len:334 (-) Transcript_40435:530-1531(-)
MTQTTSWHHHQQHRHHGASKTTKYRYYLVITLCLMIQNFFLTESAAFTSLPPAGRTKINGAMPVSSQLVRQTSTILSPSFSLSTERPSLYGASSELTETEEEEEEGASDEKETELTLERIAELIEVSFVNACMQLASGYIDVLKLFVASTKAAYERSISLPTLQTSLQSCPNQSANRPLMKEEEELRAVWVQLIYLTLKEVGHESMEGEEVLPGDSVSTDVQTKYEEVVRAVVKETLNQRNSDNKQPQKSAQNVPLGSSPLIKLEDLPADTQQSINDSFQDPMSKALLAQNIRVIGVTLAVLEEEERCFGEGMGGGSASSGGSPPKPAIPGAF